MVVITEELWRTILDKLEEGVEKAIIMESLLNDGFSVLEADAIYHKAKAEHERLELAKPKPKFVGMTFKKWLGQPPQMVTLIAIVTGILLPLLYYAAFTIPFSFFYGFSWMVYVLGTWVACLGTGNVPAMFGTQDNIMVAQCKSYGANTVYTQSVLHLGGLLFSLLIGCLLTIYMVYLARRFFYDDETAVEIRKMKYFAAWFNGTVGLACLTAMTYLLFHGLSGQYGLDMLALASTVGAAPEFLGKILVAAVISVWVITATIALTMLAKGKNN